MAFVVMNHGNLAFLAQQTIRIDNGNNSHSDGNSHNNPQPELSFALANQLRLQGDFHMLVSKNQNPVDCTKRRILLLDWEVLQFQTMEQQLQTMACFLQTAVATDRTLVISTLNQHQQTIFTKALTAMSATSTTINREPQSSSAIPANILVNTTALSNCTIQNIGIDDVHLHPFNKQYQLQRLNASASLRASLGIFNHEGSTYFSTKFYGNQRIVTLTDQAEILGLWTNTSYVRYHIDHIQHWERIMGRYWLRSQLVQYLWQRRLRQSYPSSTVLSNVLPLPMGTPYIGMDLRISDEQHRLSYDHFGRYSEVVHSMDNFMIEAEQIRSETGISIIYLVTLDTFWRDWIRRLYMQIRYSGWTIYIQNHAPWKRHRAATATNVDTDFEILRRADYLVGSFQMDTFRLVTELNTVYHSDTYLWHVNRHRTVSIEWFENPI
jgi:hypothetical protein